MIELVALLVLIAADVVASLVLLIIAVQAGAWLYRSRRHT